jgi:hypothetical protein
MELSLLLVLHTKEIQTVRLHNFFATHLFGNVKTFSLLTQTWSTATSDFSVRAVPPYRYG